MERIVLILLILKETYKESLSEEVNKEDNSKTGFKLIVSNGKNTV
ncbi:hypothetical protein [Clostridium beijerinckii]|nr:hypothetical protein [Clostridium beijerinckii]